MAKKEIIEKNPTYNSIKKIKYIRTNLTKEAEHLYIEN
jgi:hypothetical protein